MDIFTLLIVFVITFLIVLFVILLSQIKSINIEPPHKNAGRYGERVAKEIIEKYLDESDVLLSNVSIVYDDRPAEFDNIIINKFGVYIVEVKNYSGELYGDEDDFEWEKYKTTDAGNTYVKTVINPIKQVKRQIYLLASFLRSYGVDVWVNGYVMLIEDNSPVDNEYILLTYEDLYSTFHTKNRCYLSEKTIKKICNILTEDYSVIELSK